MQRKTIMMGRAAHGQGRAQGFTLIEMLIVATIFATIFGGIAYFALAATDSFGETSAAQNLTAMSGETVSFYNAQGDFAGVSAQTLIDNGIPPETMVQGNQIVHNWSGQVTVAAAALQNPADSVTFTYNDVNSESCAGFVRSSQSGFARVSVGGTVVKPQGGTLQVGNLGQNCGNGSVDIAFTAAR